MRSQGVMNDAPTPVTTIPLKDGDLVLFATCGYLAHLL